MSRSKSLSNNSLKRWKKIQQQFKVRISERTISGATPSFASVVDTLAEDWCVSPGTIEEILRKKI